MEHSKLVGAVSNCAVSTDHDIYAVRFPPAPTGRRKCSFIFRIHYKLICRFPQSGWAPINIIHVRTLRFSGNDMRSNHCLTSHFIIANIAKAKLNPNQSTSSDTSNQITFRVFDNESKSKAKFSSFLIIFLTVPPSYELIFTSRSRRARGS